MFFLHIPPEGLDPCITEIRGLAVPCAPRVLPNGDVVTHYFPTDGVSYRRAAATVIGDDASSSPSTRAVSE